MAEWIRQNEPELFNDEDRKMGFGKHSDQTWDWVIENDNSYTDYAILQGPRASGRLGSFARYAEEKRQAEEWSRDGVARCWGTGLHLAKCH